MQLKSGFKWWNTVIFKVVSFQRSKWPASEGQVCSRQKSPGREWHSSQVDSVKVSEIGYQSWKTVIFHPESLHFRNLFSFVAESTKQVRESISSQVSKQQIHWLCQCFWHLTGFPLLSSCLWVHLQAAVLAKEPGQEGLDGGWGPGGSVWKGRRALLGEGLEEGEEPQEEVSRGGGSAGEGLDGSKASAFHTRVGRQQLRGANLWLWPLWLCRQFSSSLLSMPLRIYPYHLRLLNR